jgi:ABC-2 type transport system permease protein
MLRDRTSMFFVLLLPFFIILIVGSATKQFNRNEVPVGVAVQGTGPRTTDLVRSIDHTRGLIATRVDDVDKLQKALRRGVYSAGVVIPADYDARLIAGRPVNVTFIADQTRPPAAVRAAVSSAVAKESALVQAARFASAHSRTSFATSLAQAQQTARITPEIGVTTQTTGTSKRAATLTGFEYIAPGQLVLFAFITAIASAGVMIAKRQQGITRRMFGTPTSARTLVIGELLTRFVQTAFQALFVVVIGALIFGVNFGDPLAAVVLIALFVLVATSIGVLAGTLFRTPEQAGSVGPPLGIAAGMLAGCMWPRFIMPSAMQHLGQLFPQAWAVDGFIRLVDGGAHLRGILPQLAILAGYLVVILPIATWRLRRSLVT